MSNIKVNVSGLRNLYRSDSSARLVLNSLASRQNKWSMTTVSSLFSYLTLSGFNISRNDIINTFTELQRLNCGEFKLGNKTGNRNHQTRFIWKESLMRVGKLAKEPGS
jgi:hypothetical protein